jgi:hypothetical protein
VIRQLRRDLRPKTYGHGSDGQGGGWPGLRQVVEVSCVRQSAQSGEILSSSRRIFLTSLSPSCFLGEPARLLELIQGHWGIENKLHHVKDRSMREDQERCRGDAAPILAWARSLAVFLMGFLQGCWAPDKFQKVLKDDSLASNLLTRPLQL